MKRIRARYLRWAGKDVFEAVVGSFGFCLGTVGLFCLLKNPVFVAAIVSVGLGLFVRWKEKRDCRQTLEVYL